MPFIAIWNNKKEITRNKDILIICTLLFCFILSFLFLKDGNFIRAIFGIIFILFLPGFALTALFPPLIIVERIALSLGASIALSPLIGLTLNYTPWGIRSMPIIIALTIIIISICSFAHYRRSLAEKPILLDSNPVKFEAKPNQELLITSILSCLLLPIIAYYFKFFPTILNPVISDWIITGLVFFLIMTLVLGSFSVRSSGDVFYILPQCLVFTFLSRAVRYLRLPYPALWDPYAFLVSFLNIHNYNTLSPILDWWLPNLDGLLHWPLMLLITEELVLMTGLDYMYLFKFQEPILGMAFFLGAFILGREITNSDRTALLAALFSSLASHVIFYQSEYHYQGLALIILVFYFYSFIKSESNDTNKISWKILMLLFVSAFILSHYFSSIFLGLIFSVFFVITLSFVKLKNVKKWPIRITIGNNSSYISFIIITISSLSYHIYTYSKHFDSYVRMVLFTLHSYDAPLFGSSIPFPTNIIKNMRWPFFVLVMISVMYIWKTNDKKEFYLAVLLICLIIFGFVGEYFVFLEVGRIVTFYEALAGTFVALTLVRFVDVWMNKVSKDKKTFVAGILASIIITCGFFGGHYQPSYYFKSFEMNEYYWCSNRLPKMDEYEMAGKWIKFYTIKDAKFVIDRNKYDFICSMVFFWGEKTPTNIIASNNVMERSLDILKDTRQQKSAYIVLNQAYDHSYEELLHLTNRIYTNSEIEIYIGQR